MTAEWIPLQPDEPLGVVALSGVIGRERLRAGLELLRADGRELLLAPNLASAHGYLAGTDRERAEGLVSVLDRGARVVLAARGGSGATRLLDDLPWQRLVDDRIQLVGFSDLTAVLNPLLDRGAVAQVHGPMVAAADVDAVDVSRLLRLLALPRGSTWEMEVPASTVVRPGRAAGPARGGNLALLAALVGTPYAPRLDGAVVFLEDVSEPLYRLDRMLTQLAASGTFRGVKALVCGSLRDCPAARSSSPGWRDLLLEAVPEGAVVVDGLPFGHGRPNVAFPLGVAAEIDTAGGRVRWSI